MAKSGTTAKILTAIGLFILSFVFSYSPFWIKGLKTNNRLIGAANSFAGGIFLSVALIHTIPDAMELWSSGHESEEEGEEDHSTAEEHGHSDEFPWVTFTALCSFCIILLIDRIIIKHSHSHGEEECKVPHIHHHHEAHAHVHDGQQHGNEHRQEVNLEAKEEGELFANENKDGDQQNQNPGAGNVEAQGLVSEVRRNQINIVENQRAEKISKQETQIGEESGAVLKKKSAWSPYALVIAMGVHAFFEGLALGLMKSLGGYLGFLAAIVFHKWAESLAIGLGFLRAKAGLGSRLFGTILFAFIAPIGVIIGLLLDDAGVKTKAIMLGISSGTFFYISIAEIISEEFINSKGLYWRFLAFISGVVLMIITWIVERAGHKSAEEEHRL